MAVLQPKLDLELDEGETILYVTRRHWIVLLQRGFIFALAFLISGGLATYRALGGRFIVSGVAPLPQNDFINIILIGLILLLVILWLYGRDPKRKRKVGLRDILYLLTIGVVALAVIFRYGGGRLFHIDPFNTGAGSDLLNILLVLAALVMAVILVYNVIDWANDFLILTNTRVVYDDTQLLIRHVQQQVLIENVQQVLARTESYPEHWLGYGTLVISSLSPRRLVFSHAIRPQQMQMRILDEVNKIRKRADAERLGRLIEDQVYGNTQPSKPKPAIHVEERSGLIPWLFATNPEIDFEREIVIWRPFWIFLILAMLRPIGIFALASIGLVLLLRLGIFSAALVFAVWLPIALVSIGWAFWIREEHEHDLYILTRQDITDVDKRPFGPESRRRASLGTIQDISYDVSFIENILGYGDVLIETGGAGGKFTFNHVPDPRGVEATLNDYLTDFRKREKEQQQQATLDLLKQYHVAQGAHNELMDQERVAALIAEQVSAQLAQSQAAAAGDNDLRVTVRNELWRMLRRRRFGRRRL
ncbi:MAG TPA: PH domain-containing protein [Roseiflexaceae bacterium]